MDISLLSKMVITKVYTASTFYTAAGVKKRNTRRGWGIIIKYEGETVYTSNGKKFLSNLNHIILLPNGCSYSWECTKAGHFIALEFECSLSYPEPIVFSIRDTHKILEMFKSLEHKRGTKKPMTDVENIRDMYSIILALTDAASREAYIPTDKQKKIDLAVEYISRHYNEPLTNDSLAKLVGLSTTYFRRLFSLHMGVPPITYLHRLRIERAKEMLRCDYGTISYIAEALGYASIYDFSRDFKKHTGTSPSKYTEV